MGLKRSKALPAGRQVNILGVEVDDISEENAIKRILNLARDKKNFHYVVTVNPEFVMLARSDPNFAKILANADLSLADGAGVVLAKLILGGKEHERIAGVDLVEKLCQRAAENAVAVGFLGGFDGVANMVAKRQKLASHGLKLAYAGPDFETIGREMKLKTSEVAKIRADILFVAYGMGRQEFWIAKNRNLVNFGVAIGVGGAFDFLAGVKKRAPISVQNLGLEWLWRLLMEPSRIWRMRVLPIFLVLVLMKKFFNSKF